MIRRTLLTLSTAAGLSVLAASSALAASLPAANSGTISAYVPSTAGTATTQPTYEGRVAFTTTGTERLKNPRVWVSCSQNGVVVYGAGGSPTETFKLGGGSSLWVSDGGGAATCTVALYYILNAKQTGEWNGNGAQGPDVTLATASFDAAA